MRYVITLLLFSSILNAQEFYILDGENTIYIYDYNTGFTDIVATVNAPSSMSLTDIAYADSEHFYGIDSQGTIINIDLETGDYTTVYQWPNGYQTAGLAYSNNHLYFINAALNELIEYDINNNVIVSETDIGTGNSGDITFYQGNLLFQGSMSQDVLAYDGTIVKSVACAESLGLWGMANYTTSCGNNLVLAFDSGGAIWEYDIDGQTNSQIDSVGSTIGGINGATTINEQFAYDCNLVELDEVYCKFLRDDHVFVCEFKNVNGLNSIRYLDTGYNLYHLFDLDLGGARLMDIAFSSEGLFYGITEDQEILQIFPDGTFESVAEIGGIEGYNGLVGNEFNQLLLIGSSEAKILIFDLTVNAITSEIELPEGSHGDATYFKGNLLYPGLSNDLYAYDGSEAKTVLCNDISPFYAISNRLDNCVLNDVVVFTENGILYRYVVEGNPGLNYERNLSSGIDVIYGAASRVEYLGSDCDLVNLPEVDCSLSYPEASSDPFRVYPIPAKDVVYISTSGFEEEFYYSIYSLDGKLLDRGTLKNELNIQRLSAGVYFLKLYNSDRTMSTNKKIIKE